MPERIYVQRNPVVKHTGPRPDDGPLAAEGSPGDTGARRNAETFRNALPLQARAQIEERLRVQRPVILREKRRFQVGVVIRTPAREIDAAQQSAFRIQNLDGPGRDCAAIAGARHLRAEFQVMRPDPAPWGEGPRFDPLRAPGFPVLRTEIVPAIALGSQHHIGRTLRSDLGIETLDRDGAVQHAAVYR